MADRQTFGWGAFPGDLTQRWPKTAGGDPVPPVFLTHCASTDLADTVLINLLEAYGIPALRLYPGDGAFGKVVLGMSGTGSSIYVPETLFAQAKELMEADSDDELQSGV